MECDDRIINEISRISCAFDVHLTMEKLYRVRLVQHRLVLEQEQKKDIRGREKNVQFHRKKLKKKRKNQARERCS